MCDDFSVGCQISVVDTDMYAGQKSLKVDLGASRHRMNVCHWSLFHHWSPPWLQVDQRTAEWGGPVQTLDRDTLGDLQGGRLSYALKLSRHTSLNIIGGPC